MAGSSFISYRFSREAATSRFRLALASSALAHFLLATGMAVEPPHRNALRPQAIPITARLDRPPADGPAIVADAEAKKPDLPRPGERLPVKSDETRDDRLQAAVSMPAPEAVPPLALQRIPDATVYGAGDLDSYPRPIDPLDLDRLAGRFGGTPHALGLELVIDEYGVVNRVAFAAPGLPGAVEDGLRTEIAAIRFVPATREGRAVKSRVQIAIRFGK